MTREEMIYVWQTYPVYSNNLRNGWRAGRAVKEPPNRDAQARLKFARKYYVALKQREEERS